MHIVGTHKVYTRAAVADEWVERPHMRIPKGAPVDVSAGKITTAPIVQTYARTTEATAGYIDLANHWVRISYTPDPSEGGDETDLFYGHLSDQELQEATGDIYWQAVSIEAQLDKVRLIEGFGQPVVSGDDCEPVTLPIFNESLDANRKLGIRGDQQYTFVRGDDYRSEDDEGNSIAYTFGTSELWDAWQVLRALLAWHTPEGGSRHCAIGFEAVATTAAQTALEAVKKRWNLLGQKLRTAITRLVASAGDLAWSLDWSESGDYGYDFCRVRVWSRKYDDRDESTQTTHNVAGAGSHDCLDSRVTVTVRNRVTDVVVMGERIKVQLTTSYDMANQPQLRRGWTDADESAYAAAVADHETVDPNGPGLQHVYRRIYVPFDQVSGSTPTWDVFLKPIPGDNFGTEGDKVPLEGTGFINDCYPHPRRILPYNLTQRGIAYTSQATDATLSASRSGAEGEPEHHPILCWWAANPTPTGARVLPVTGIRRLDNECGVLLPPQYRSGAKRRAVVVMDDPPGVHTNWQDLVLTLSIETDERLSWTASQKYDLTDGSGGTDEQRVPLVIRVPGMEWWAAVPDTYLAIDNDWATETKVYGVLRNDLPKLKTLAEDILERYSTRLMHADLPLVKIDVSKKLGDFIGNYGPYTLKNPILTLRQHLDVGRVGTEVITGIPWQPGGRRLI